MCRSRDDSIENLFEDDEIVGDLPNEEGMHAFNINVHVINISHHSFPRSVEFSAKRCGISCFATEMSQAVEFGLFRRNCQISANALQMFYLLGPAARLKIIFAFLSCN